MHYFDEEDFTTPAYGTENPAENPTPIMLLQRYPFS